MIAKPKVYAERVVNYWLGNIALKKEEKEYNKLLEELDDEI